MVIDRKHGNLALVPRTVDSLMKGHVLTIMMQNLISFFTSMQ